MDIKPSRRISLRLILAITMSSVPLPAYAQTGASGAAVQSTSSSASSSSLGAGTQSKGAPNLPRGKKLIMKDGSYQMIREYQIIADRVRYYSVDSGGWEEIPAALVDWNATKKDEAREKQQTDAFIAAEKKRESERVIPQLDVDASVEAAPGIFLPDGNGLFAFDGQSIVEMKTTDMSSRLDKKKSVEKVLVPIPIVPTRHFIELNGPRAGLRLRTSQPEFYIRTADGTQPPLELVHAKVRDGVRQLEKVDQLLDQQLATGDTIAMQRWPVAPNLYRFTLSQALAPGEYALVQITRTETMSFLIWDFGVDTNSNIVMPKIK